MTVLRTKRTSAPALLAGLVALGIAGPLQAQTADGGQPPPPSQAPATAPAQFSDQQLESFAAAAQRVNELGQKWGPRIEDVTSEQEAMKLRSEANAEMAAAVKEEGLSPAEFREIYQAALTDPALNSRIGQMMDQAQ